MNVGILLPASSTHPLIPHDFSAGLKSGLDSKGEAAIKLCFGYIGFGTDEALLKQEAERLIIEHNVAILVAFADHPVVDVLFPIVAQLNKLLLVVNSGAKYPCSKHPNVYFHTLESCYTSYLTSVSEGREPGKSAMATSFYDGGYSLCHAITQPFTDAGGTIEYNFAGSFKLEEFAPSQLSNFLSSAADINSVFTVLSGNLVEPFYKDLGEKLPDRSLTLHGTHTLIEETSGNYSECFPASFSLKGFVSWDKMLANEENQGLLRDFSENTGLEASSFAALGYDTGLILLEVLQLAEGKVSKLPSVMADSGISINGAKGTITLDPDTHHFLGDVYQVEFTKINGLELRQTISHHEGKGVFKEMVAQELTGSMLGWKNTYLCS